MNLKDPVMSSVIQHQHKLENAWSRLARYQHHERFLSKCLDKNVIPKGLELKFNLCLLSNNLDLQRTCKQHLSAASLNMLKEIHSATKKELTSLVGNLGRARIEATQELGKEAAESIIKKTKFKISKLKIDLSRNETKKLAKTVKIDVNNLLPLDDNITHVNNTNNEPRVKKRNRRFDKRIRSSRRSGASNCNNATNRDGESDYTTGDSKLDPINLSNVSLTEAQKQVMRKGPKFCPAPKDVNWMKMTDDWKRFERRIRLTAHHHGKGAEQEKDGNQSAEAEELYPQVPGKARNWNPPKSSIPEIEVFLAAVKRELFNPDNLKVAKDNLTQAERSALKELKADNDRVIRMQDKGSRFVILEKKDYITKIEEHLNNPLHYERSEQDPTDLHLDKVRSWASKWLKKKQITEDIAKWVVNEQASPGTAFGNVKTHKDNNPVRLITSCCGTAIENLSAFTEFYLKPLAYGLPSFVRDTTDLLNRIDRLNRSGPLPDNTLLVSWDVVGMFPNIDNNLGLSAVKNALNTRTTKIPSTKCILEAVEICLKNNNSQFRNNSYLQIHGTAMGPKNACSYADLAMGEIDKLAKSGAIKPSCWWRYRDDILDFWTLGEQKLLEFTEYIHSLYPTIKFTFTYSKDKINFLDLTLHLVDGKIETDIYSKPTDSHLYLPPSSSHPYSCIKSIPYSVGLRIKRNCSNNLFLQNRTKEYKGYLTGQGYSQKIVNKQFQKAFSVDRDNLLKVKAKSRHSNVIPLVIDFNANLPNITKILKRNLHLLDSTEQLKNIFSSKRIVTAYRRPKNLKEILAPSKLKQNVHKSLNSGSANSNNVGCFKCINRCDLCINFLESTTKIY